MNRTVHFIFSITVTIAISFWFFNQILVDSYPERSPYEGVEIRFNNIPKVRTSDYIVKKKSGQFLLARGAPGNLRLHMEFLSAGDFTAVVSSEYSPRLCKQHQLDEALQNIQGGSLNEDVKLVRNKATEINFSISKGQVLRFRVQNKDNSDCGRATIEFYEVNSYGYFMLLFVLIWASMFVFCWTNKTSPYIATLGVISSFLFISSNATVEVFGTGGLVISTVGGIVVAAALLIFSAIALRSRLITVFITALLTAVLIVPLAFIAYMHVFGAPLDVEAIHGAMQSYDSQAIEFWRQFIGKRNTLYFILVLVGLYACLRHINLSKPNIIPTYLCGVLLLCLSLLATVGRAGDNYIANLLTRSIIEYKWEIEAFQKVASLRKQNATTAIRDPLHANDKTVIVVGESVNKKHMSSYGYPRETTPLMDKRIAAGEAIQFNRAYSNHTHSNPTMSFILTQANQYNGRSWLESPSVFNYARSANVGTQWLTNHRILGGWSNRITTIVKESDRLKTINYKIGYGNSSSHYDHDLIPLYRDALKKHKNQITFLHLYNSHSSYCNRYPESASIFKADGRESLFGELQKLQTSSMRGIACYDNTISYTDDVLNQLIQELEKSNEPSVLLYVADHAEEPIAGLNHNSAILTFDMINIPLIIWANEAWQQKHSKLWANLHANKNKVVTNDLMFESILGIAGIKDSSIDTKFDITSSNYRSLEKPLTLHGRVKVDHPENWNYWQSQNSLAAIENDVELVASDIRSIGEGHAALQYGISSQQVNVKYSSETGITFSDVDSLSLSDFLKSLDDKKLVRLFLNFVDQKQNIDTSKNAKLKALADEYQIEIIEVNDAPSTVKDLSSPKFIAETKQGNGSEPIWVALKTRYRYKAPVAW